jgi:hypothetical protein
LNLRKPFSILMKTKRPTMKSLLAELREIGLDPHRIDQSLFIIYEWLEDYYPTIAQLYRTEILKKAWEEKMKIDDGESEKVRLPER